MSENQESILRRIDKLLAMARHERSNTADAATAASMAARLMKKHQISEGDVLIAKLKSGADLVTGDTIPTLANWNEPLKRVPLWANRLAVAVARLTDTQVVIAETPTEKGLEKCLRFRGYQPDVQLAIYVMTYLQTNMRRLRLDFMKSYTYKEKGLSSLRSYTDGLTLGTIDAINTKIRENEEDTEMSGAAGSALVVAKEAAIAAHFGDVSYKKGSRVSGGYGFSQGVEDGRKTKINPAVGGAVSAPLSISLSA